MYDKDKTKKALAAWGNEAIGKAFQSLQEQKLVVRMNERNRFVPVRGYRMSDKYIPQPGILLMCRWGLSLRSYFADTLLDEGEKFFKSLVEVFGQGKGLLISNMTTCTCWSFQIPQHTSVSPRPSRNVLVVSIT